MSPLVDLHFRGRPRVIAAAVLHGPDGLTLVDPGPASCLPALEAGLAGRGARLSDVRALLLTHIHLDHAGAAGTIAGRIPGVRVWVHARGAPHVIDPTRLVSSASRLYGDAMGLLWGEVLPVPAERVHVVSDGDRVAVGGRAFQVVYTPGHAVHHVTYLDETDGVAYVGDTAGIRVVGASLIAPTPPPDIDLEAWRISLDRIEALHAQTLFITHFGAFSDVDAHLHRFRRELIDAADTVRATLGGPGTDDERIADFVSRTRARLRQTLSSEDAQATELAAPFPQLWQGLARYWRKREQGRT
jgi:glyoxylase-like metal-dependent hydrolase (beta-lactamase superfamily II)